ncbi:MAG TPA: hypothetical protein VLO11_03805, partial [Luteolibacter sp.]|nr:hypothetical protein [Luteolibacter sp.]
MKMNFYPTVLALLAFAIPSQAAVILGGDFLLYKPGSTTVTASIPGSAYVPWLSSIPNPTSPTSLTVSGGSATYSDSTTGPTVDLIGWSKTQGGADLLNNGVDGSSALNLFAAWGGTPRPIVETTGSLHTIGSGETITISTMVGGPS